MSHFFSILFGRKSYAQAIMPGVTSTTYQNMMGAAFKAAHAEMERQDRIADLSDDLSDVADDAQEEAATTSVEELLDILAELSERVTRLERAMVMLLSDNRDASQSTSQPEVQLESQSFEPEVAVPFVTSVARPERPAPPRVVVSPAPAPLRTPPPLPAADTLSATEVDFDLPSHQWGAEGLTEKARNSGPLTPIQHSDYPEIKAPEEAQVAPKRKGPPERVFVRAALESYPHIVESVCLMWGGREADAYLNKLVIDTRGGRKGFPRDVMDDLIVLVEVCTLKSGLKPDFTPFDRDRSREREG
jgi:hypothetical protein